MPIRACALASKRWSKGGNCRWAVHKVRACRVVAPEYAAECETRVRHLAPGDAVARRQGWFLGRA